MLDFVGWCVYLPMMEILSLRFIVLLSSTSFVWFCLCLHWASGVCLWYVSLPVGLDLRIVFSCGMLCGCLYFVAFAYGGLGALIGAVMFGLF